MKSVNDVQDINDMLAKFVEDTDAALRKIGERLDLIEQRQTIGFKELGLDITKVKMPSRRVAVLGGAGVAALLMAAASFEPNPRHASQTADPIDWSSVGENDAINAGKPVPEDIEEAKARIPKPVQDGAIPANAEVLEVTPATEILDTPVQESDAEASIEG